jgi:ATP-dependent helicase/nuclease subunit A
MSGPASVHPLHGNQMKAVSPEDTVWLSASAGTGKTQVLSSRVLRLLLTPGVDPSQILCLTFTKAGATEMAARINGTLADWVRLPNVELFQRLEAIGAKADKESIAHARTLFASVLDCPGGGLRIDTIHAFAQWLLAAFPHEAGLMPGTKAMEDRDRLLLFRQVLSDLLVDAETNPLGDRRLPQALADLSLRMGPEEVEKYLLRCAQAREAWFGPGGWQEPMRPNVHRLIGLAADAEAGDLAALCGDGSFDTLSLQLCLSAYRQWPAATGQAGAATIANWLSLDGAGRLAAIDDLYKVLFGKEQQVKNLKSLVKFEEYVEEAALRTLTSVIAVRDMAALLALADRLVPALRLGRAFALAWEEAKQREGLIDFDDQIRRAAELLNTSELADWIRYKLDRRFDHILVDEAQDTNAAQWRIIDALTGDFFAGHGQRGDALRTLFVVGDYKQAIFRFQGTSPENFEKARQRVQAELFGAVENAAQLDIRESERPRPLRQYGLDRSFRTAQPVLNFVDAAIASIGHAQFGLPNAPESHEGEERPGYVALWHPIGQSDDDADEIEDADDGQENWLSRPDRQMAERIARQVREWMDPDAEGFALAKGGARRAGPGDIMVLVRKRRELAGLIVARLHAAGVPVAGVDRLRLGAPLAVRDLVAALRFGAQPLDDLNLAALLVSPLIGWSQEELLEYGYRVKGHLWNHLRASRQPRVAATLDMLGGLLALADYEPPQALLHWLLVGPWQGRRKLIARLGREANDPIDELLNAASAYAASATPSLVGFLAWFDAGEGELKREAGNSDGLVRVMTVHGSKGLQAPIVILADATGNPDDRRGLSLDLADPAAPEDRAIPLPGLRKEERVGRIAEAQAIAAQAEAEEHWRLLYVAMTRAEEALFIGGALSSREKEPSPNSWYAKLRLLFGADEAIADPLWEARLEWGEKAPAVAASPAGAEAAAPAGDLPSWLNAPSPAEPRPPRPLAPSGLGEDLSADPPYPPGAGLAAARRGTLIHKLLERLPAVAEPDRAGAAARWLERSAADLDRAARAELAASALAVVSHPEWAGLFSSAGLAEVPIAALVGERVIAGTIDRLLIEPDRIRLIDFKTARRPPEDIAQVPAAVLRQLAAYAAALEAAYPGRAVEAAVLYTSAPRLIAIPPETISRHKAALLAME